MTFNRSQFSKELHSQARESQRFYEQQTGEKGKYSDFLKVKNNPTKELIMAYRVEFKQDYRSGSGQEFNFERENFIIYVPVGKMSKGQIEEETRQRIAETFKHPNQVNAIYSGKTNLEIEVDELRGMEQEIDFDTRDVAFSSLSSKGSYISKDPRLSISGKAGSKKYLYTLEVFK